MKFVSTRAGDGAYTLSAALRQGAAPGGGLFMPERVPRHDRADFTSDMTLARFAAQWLRPFFAGDALAADLDTMCADAFSFPVPLLEHDAEAKQLKVLELFHGPTGAFKDFGARFLMGCFDRLAGDEVLTVLAATSGDTGAAVGCAADGRHSVRAVILYPEGRVSPFQEKQLTAWGGNVTAVQVDGDFDGCQRLVKAAFADPVLSARHRLTSANSINIGRLLPQIAYSAHAAFRAERLAGGAAGFIVPSGNLGHGVAVLMAKAMGAPIGPVVLATNANRTLLEWQRSGDYAPRPSLPTLANAMDVGDPSNFERLRALGVSPRDVTVELVDDEAIRRRIGEDHARTGYVWCPHSAIAAEAFHRLAPEQRRERPWIAAATAHPYKFAEIVEPLIGRKLPAPPQLAAIAGRPSHKHRISERLESLADLLEEDAHAVR